LEFTNTEELVDNKTADLKALQILHGRASQDNYQLHGSNNCFLNLADAYVNRQLTIQYSGVKDDINSLVGHYIYWYIPENASMLTYDEKKLQTEGFSRLSALPVAGGNS
jgi:hypothetical protein